MRPPPKDIAEPSRQRQVGCNILLIGLLLVLIAALAYWGYEASESGAPNPSATGVPPTAPPGAAPR